MVRFGLIISVSILVANALSQDMVPRLTNAEVDQGNPPQISKNVGAGSATNPEVQSLLDDSEALPPEFTSDILLQLVENGFIRDDLLKVKLLSSAFEKAEAAEDDVMRRPLGVNVEETPQGLHAIASTVTRLDRISLQTRVVHQFLAINPRRARQVFESIPPPHLEPLSCSESWYFAPDAYYDAFALVLQKGFSAREIAGGFRASYVSSIIQNIQSHFQLLAVARLLGTGSFTERERREIVPAYSVVFGDLHGDAFSFDLLMSESDAFWDAISKLFASLDKNNTDSRTLLQALRNYLVLNFNGPNCRKSQTPKSPDSTVPNAISQFNERFRAQLAKQDLDPIRQVEIKNEKGSVDDSSPPRWKSHTYSQLLESLQRLNPSGHREGTGPDGITESDRRFFNEAGDLLNS